MQELVEGVLHDIRLVRHLRHLHADGQRVAEGIDLGPERVAEVRDIRSRRHHDTDTHRFGTVQKGEIGWRVFVTPAYGRDVAKPEDLSAGGDGQFAQRVEAADVAADPHLNVVGRGREGACRRHGVLMRDGIEDRLGRNAQGGEPAVADLHEDALLHLADECHLGSAIDGKQAAA